MECCICKQEIPAVGGWTHGNDAWPAADGRCCNECDALVVIPARLIGIMARRKKQEASHA